MCKIQGVHPTEADDTQKWPGFVLHSWVCSTDFSSPIFEVKSINILLMEEFFAPVDMATFPIIYRVLCIPGGKTDPGFLVAINSIRYDPAIIVNQTQHVFQEIRKAKGVVARQVPDEAGHKRKKAQVKTSGDGMIEKMMIYIWGFPKMVGKPPTTTVRGTTILGNPHIYIIHIYTCMLRA